MQIDPNKDMGMSAECILCRGGKVYTYTGDSTAMTALADINSSFYNFCSKLDPNLQFVVAFVPDSSDSDVFKTARQVAESMGLSMQAPFPEPEVQMQQWQSYCTAKYRTVKTQ